MRILVPQLMNNDTWVTNHGHEGHVNHDSFPAQIAQLFNRRPESFRPHWEEEFNHRYSIMACQDGGVVGYAEYNFSSFKPADGAYFGHITCLGSRNLDNGQMSHFLTAVVKKYAEVLVKLAAMDPAAIDQPLEMPHLFLFEGQRRWAQVLRQNRWRLCPESNDYSESTPFGPGSTMMHEPPYNFIR